MVACAPRGSGFAQDCTQCHDPDKRKEWGCDEPAAEPVAYIEPCPFCAGLRPDCAHCEGTDRIPIRKCPNKLVGRREIDMVMACAMTEQGILPDPGGWEDQAATFTSAWPLVMREIHHWRGIAQHLAMQKARKK